MQIHRFYCDSINQPRTVITGPEARHAASVMRLKEGQPVELFDGRGTLTKARIEKISAGQVTCRIENIQTAEKPAWPRIIIAASVPKADRFDLLIAKCTELGADRITPVMFERCVKQPKNPKAQDRWRNITISAAKQCKRLFLPEIDKPLPLTEAISKLAADYPASCMLVGSLADNAKPLLKIEFKSKDVITFIGPEGGLTDAEIELLTVAGAVPVRITDAVLRVETAAIAFAAVLSAARNNLRNGY
jgi:16S rRNA (uracil1498-N3)-methyltransferase